MATFRELTNQLLVRINEVELSQSDFSNVKGVHRLARNSVNDALRDIHVQDMEWPFNYVQKSQVLTPGIHLYDLPTDYLTVDQESFFLMPNEDLNARGNPLQPISWDEWNLYYRSMDKHESAKHIPQRVFLTPYRKFGVSPPPDKGYQVQFHYYKQYVPLVNHNDVTLVPDAFSHVIVDGAFWYMTMLRDNQENAQLAQRKFNEGIKRMRTVLINKNEHMRDTRVPGRG